MRASRRYLLIMVTLGLVALATQMGWRDWRNRQFDAVALQLAEGVKPYLDEATSLMGGVVHSGDVPPELERQILDVTNAMEEVRRQAEALPPAPDRVQARDVWIGLVQALQTQPLEIIESLKELPAGAGAEGALIRQRAMQQVQAWNNGYHQLLPPSQTMSPSGGDG